MLTIKSIYQDKLKLLMRIKPLKLVQRFSVLFYVAYCKTIHKSQGSLFDFDYTIHEWHKLDKTLKYVALSWATKKNLIYIIWI